MANNKSPIGKKSNGQMMGQFGGQILSGLFILALIVALYSALVDRQTSTDTISLSEVAQGIIAGQISSIEVQGDEIEVRYANEEVKKSKKEAEAGLSETLANYGVTPEQLARVKIEIAGETGFAFWLLNILPIAIP
ncbi:MAG TPA: ATP-dependent metallopeptidase FtsH/Yme1/Tma family protein, partial [Candidatus Paceibacterota bacterium]|nr:ATP-dependent metallopeptidase FtsH/Yme1/Tma family protein [Candidatus Paceibacterota bacterium]